MLKSVALIALWFALEGAFILQIVVQEPAPRPPQAISAGALVRNR
jgi:hypothetical protein